MTIAFSKDNVNYEITPFRAKSIQDDLKLRDLTINSIAFKVRKGIIDFKEVVDPFGGIVDIKFNCLRTADGKNFDDDPLRILRVFRFQSKLGFDIESLTWKEAQEKKDMLKEIAKERVLKEFEKLLIGTWAGKALRNLAASGVRDILFPGTGEDFDFLHSDLHHSGESVYEHSIRVLKLCPAKEGIRWAALLHDLGKRDAHSCEKGIHHYIGHEKKSIPKIKKIFGNLNVSINTQREIFKIVENHMIPLESEKTLTAKLFDLGRTDFSELCQFIKADKLSKFSHKSYEEKEEFLESKFQKVFSKEKYLNRIREEINGERLKNLGIRQGPWIGIILTCIIEKSLKKPEEFSESFIKIETEKLLRFKDEYKNLYFRKINYIRSIEYYENGRITGLLEGGESLKFLSEIFEYEYLTPEEFEKWLSQKKQNISILFSAK